MIEAPKRFEENPSEATEVKKNGTERLGMDQDGVAKKIAVEILLTKENVELGNVTNPGLSNGSTLATDLKLITISGNYIYSAGTTNAPTAAAGYAQAMITDSNNRLVIATVAGNDGVIHLYHIQMVAGVWTAWSQAYELNYAKLNYVQFNEGITAVPTAVGSIYWDDDAKTVSLVLPDGVIAQIPEELYVNVVRDSAAPNPIVNGTPVYTIGEQGQKPRVGVARADTKAKTLVTGIATHNIANQGRITTFGLIRAVPLSVKPSGETWVAGNYLWLAPTGGMTNVEPSAPTPNVRIGLITNVTGSASFDMLVYIRPAMGMYDLYDVNGDFPAEGSELSFDFTHGYWKATNRLTQAEADILLKLNKSDVADNLTTDDASKALSAKQGKTLSEQLSSLDERVMFIEHRSKLTTWADVQDAAKNGLASRYLKVGDLVETSYGGSPAVVELIGINHPFDIPPVGVEYGDVLSWGFKDCLQNAQYSAPQALFNAVEGLSAGTYTFVNSYTSLPCTFTLTQAVPAGGVIVITSWGEPYNPLVIKTMQADRLTNIETGVAVTQASGGTVLAPVNLTPRCRYGANLYIESGIRHFLNDNSDSYLWVAQGLYDMPSTYGAGGGFLKRLDSDFASVIGPVVKKVARAAADGGGQDTFEDKVWLLSRVEMGYGTEGVTTGEQVYERWNGAKNAERIKLLSGSPRYWWLRPPYVSRQVYARRVDTDGALDDYYSNDSLGLAPGLAVY